MTKPLHLFLLPLCFAAYALSIHFGRASVWDAVLAALWIWAIMLAVFGVLRLVFRKPLVAALATTTAAVLYLYWSYPYLRIKAWGGNANWASLPALLLISMLLLGAFVFFLFKTTHSFRSALNRFFNLLFGVLFIYNSGVYAQHFRNARQLLNGPRQVEKGSGHVPVFILLFDELWNLKSLRENGFPTGDIDSFLSQKGFYLAPNSHSNYPMTHFSMASALNEQYLRRPPDAKAQVYFRDYNSALLCIRQSSFVESFRQSGYQLRNRSIFALEETQSFGTEEVLMGGKNALFSATLGHLNLWPALEKKFFPERVSRHWFFGIQRHQKLLEAIAEDAALQQPFLCYAHFFLPHPPYCYDTTGRQLSFDTSLAWTTANKPQGYAGNVKNAFSLMKKAVVDIQEKAPGAIILLVSDHGYRSDYLAGNDTARFRNFCAVYYPDRVYTGWYPDITLVNAFRLIHNKALGTALPLLPDKVVYLKDAARLEW